MATQNAQVKRLDDPFGAFVVDGFNFVKAFPDVRHWLLTHAHSDHTCGLRASFDAGTIYCSTITKRLVAREFPGRLGDRIETLDPGASVTVGRTTITAIDAGHCPGAVLFLLAHESGATALHTGDMRASPAVTEETKQALAGRAVDVLYLDTTYAAPQNDFPSQGEACAVIADVVTQELAREPKTLFLANAYSVGKENAFDAAIRASQGSKRVIQRRFNVSVPRARVSETAPTLRERSER